MPGPGAIVNSGPINEPTQLALALDHAESLAREDFLAGPSNAAALALDRALAGLAVAHRRCCAGRKAPAKAISRRSGPRESGARTLSPRALDGADVPVALATGALVLEDLAEGRFDEPRCFICSISRARSAPMS